MTIKILQFLKTRGIGGGVEKIILDYHNLLNDSQFKTYTLLPEGADYREQSKFQENFLDYKPQNNLSLFIKILFFIIKIRPNFFISHDGRGAIIAKIIKSLLFLRKMKIIGVDHGINPKKFLSYNKADIIFCISSYSKKRTDEIIREKFINNVKTYHIPNFTNLEGIKFKIKQNPKQFCIGALSRLSGEKNIDLLVKATSKLIKKKINVKLIIGGEGQMKDQLISLINKEGITDKVTFLGWVNDIEKFFNQVDIFCNPSSHETFGITTIEAMKFSTPTIISNTSGARDIAVNDIDAIILDQEDKIKLTNSIYESILKLIKNDSYRNKLAKNAYRKVNNEFSYNSVKSKISNVLLNNLSS